MRLFTILSVLCALESLQPGRAELGKRLARRGSHGQEDGKCGDKGCEN
jgi:hypothetical protein